MELVDMQGLKPCPLGGPGSSPGVGTKILNMKLLLIYNISSLEENFVSYIIYDGNILHTLMIVLLMYLIIIINIYNNKYI